MDAFRSGILSILMSATVQISYYSIRIYFDGKLHVYIPRIEFLGLQSWQDSPTNFSIEFILRGGCLKTEYDTREVWLHILSQLDSLLP
jgi:hypothetical protein